MAVGTEQNGKFLAAGVFLFLSFFFVDLWPRQTSGKLQSPLNVDGAKKKKKKLGNVSARALQITCQSVTSQKSKN